MASESRMLFKTDVMSDNEIISLLQPFVNTLHRKKWCI